MDLDAAGHRGDVPMANCYNCGWVHAVEKQLQFQPVHFEQIHSQSLVMRLHHPGRAPWQTQTPRLHVGLSCSQRPNPHRWSRVCDKPAAWYRIYSIIRRYFHESENKLPAPVRAEPKVSFDVGANDVAMMRAVFIIFLTVVCECAAAARCRANCAEFPPIPVPY
jgi:hypothetical protein